MIQSPLRQAPRNKQRNLRRVEQVARYYTAPMQWASAQVASCRAPSITNVGADSRRAGFEAQKTSPTSTVAHTVGFPALVQVFEDNFHIQACRTLCPRKKSPPLRGPTTRLLNGYDFFLRVVAFTPRAGEPPISHLSRVTRYRAGRGARVPECSSASRNHFLRRRG